MIREVRAGDTARIAEIYNYYIEETDVSFETEPLSEEAMRQRIEAISSHCPYYVAEAYGRVVGYAYAHPWKERAAYAPTLETTVYLAPDAKGRGLGAQLMLRLIEECRRLGYHTLIACITASNQESLRFHRRLGFEQASMFRAVGYKHGAYHDVIDLQLML